MNTRRSLLTAVLASTVALCLPAAAADFPKGSPKFETNYRTALAEAKKAGKPVIVVFSAAWCPPCQKMKKSVYPSEAVKPLHDKFVWAYLDIDEPDNAKVAETYKVEHIPHIVFLDKEGKSVGSQKGESDPEAFAKELTGILKKVGADKAEPAKAGA